jgi:hypothetical protein
MCSNLRRSIRILLGIKFSQASTLIATHMKKSIFSLLFLLAGLTLEVAGQEAPSVRQGRWHWQLSAGVQLAGRGEIEVSDQFGKATLSKNERYGLGASAWRDLHPHWAVGLGLNYHIHQLRYDLVAFGNLPVEISQPPNLRHAIGAMPAVRWQQAGDRGVFVELAASLRLALGETGRLSYDPYCRFDMYALREYIYEPRFAFGQALGLGYLFQVANGGAISLRVSALCEVRPQPGSRDLNYPEKFWRIQPGLELGWRWGK